jgi:hypothetical protein
VNERGWGNKPKGEESFFRVPQLTCTVSVTNETKEWVVEPEPELGEGSTEEDGWEFVVSVDSVRVQAEEKIRCMVLYPLSWFDLVGFEGRETG